MKANLYLGLAATALVLASCAQDDVIESAATAPANAIRLNATIDGFSRAQNIFSSTNPIDAFKLWAQLPDGTSYINGSGVSGADGVYLFDDGGYRYWPKDHALNFIAVNGGELRFDETTGDPILSFAHDTESQGHLDLMYAQTAVTDAGQNDVNLQFNHALSQLQFKVQVTNPSLKVVVHDLMMAGMKSKGQFNLNTETWLATSPEDEVGEVALNAAEEIVLTAQTGAKYMYDGAVNDQSGLKATDLNLQGTFMVIPQTTNGTTLILNCEIYNKESNTLIYEGNTWLPVAVEWVKGNKYIYTIDFGNTGHGGFDDEGNPVLTNVSVTTTTTSFGTTTERTIN